MTLAKLMRDCITEANKWSAGRAKKVFGDDSPDARKIKRRFKINAAASYVNVSRQAIEKAEKEGRLPPADYIDSNGVNPRPIRQGYTLEQMDMMRDHFQTQPYQTAELSPITLAIPGGKGGCYKTSTAVSFAQWCSLKGYRVLLIDIDQQSHASMYFGYHPELNTTINDTVLPFMLGEEDDLSYCIKSTAWPKLEIIPSHLQMQRLEREIQDADIDYPAHAMLQAGIATVSDNYDLIIIDGHPDLGIGTMNMICASDVTLIATSTEVNDINSTAQLMGLIGDIYDPKSQLDTTHEPIVRVLPTKLGALGSASQQNVHELMGIWPGMVFLNGIRVTDEVGKGQRRMASIYEQADDQRSSPAAWKRASDVFERTFDELLNTLIKPQWGNS